jgi:hypothetical protein
VKGDVPSVGGLDRGVARKEPRVGVVSLEVGRPAPDIDEQAEGDSDPK